MILSVKICMVCCLTKEIKKEDDIKKINNGIHEYNYSCYECLDNMKKQKEKELRTIYDKLKITGIIDE